MEFSVKRKYNLKIICYMFFVIFSFALLESNYFNLLRSFQIDMFLTNFTQIFSLNRFEKVKNFSEVVKNNLKLLPTSSSSLFHLNCYSQGTSISYVHFRSLCFLQIHSKAFFKSIRESNM